MLLKHLKNSLNTWGKPTKHKRTYTYLGNGEHRVQWISSKSKRQQSIYIEYEPDGTEIKCFVCGVKCLTAKVKYQRTNGDHKKRHTCTRKCQEELTRNHKYNPLVILRDEEGFYLDEAGYMVRRVRKLRKNGKYKGKMHRVREYMHRVVMEQHLGRKLTPYEHVHHIDMDKTNNDISNLLLCSPSDHMKIHHTFNELCEKMLKDGKIIFNDKTGKYNFNENYK